MLYTKNNVIFPANHFNRYLEVVEKNWSVLKAAEWFIFARGVLKPVSYLSASNDYLNGFCLFNRKNYRFFLPLPNSSEFLQAGILYNVFPLYLHFFSVSFLVSIITVLFIFRFATWIVNWFIKCKYYCDVFSSVYYGLSYSENDISLGLIWNWHKTEEGSINTEF